MRRSSKIYAICAAAALGLPFLGHAVVASPRNAGAAGAVLGSLKAGPARSVVMGSLASGGSSAESKHSTLLRNGQPTGSNLPSGPSTGSKSASAAAEADDPLAIANGFDGINLATANCGVCQPPDVNATVGPNHIVEAVNLDLAVYSKAGALLKSTSLSAFLGTSDGLSDPRALYDPTWDRWSLVVTDTSTPALWLAYSGGPDPTGAWFTYDLGFPLPAGGVADYPMVGMDQDAFIYTTNNYDATPSYVSSTAFAVSKARVYNGFGWSSPLLGVNFNTAPAIVGGHPAQQTTRVYLLSPDDANDVMNVYFIANAAQSPTLTFKGAIPYSWAAPPRRVNQPGTATTLDPLDGRIDWAVSQLNGNLWFAHGAGIGSFPGVNWGYVATGSMSIHVNTAFHTTTSDDFNPSIAAMSDGTTTREVLSWAYTDPPNAVATRDIYAIHVGTGVVHVAGGTFSGTGGTTSETRFGDYSSVAPEYNANGTCVEGMNALVANEYFSPVDGTWRTRLARVHPTC